MVCTKCCKKIHGSGEKGRTATSLGCLGGRHWNQVREGRGVERRRELEIPEWKKSIWGQLGEKAECIANAELGVRRKRVEDGNELMNTD